MKNHISSFVFSLADQCEIPYKSVSELTDEAFNLFKTKYKELAQQSIPPSKYVLSANINKDRFAVQ